MCIQLMVVSIYWWHRPLQKIEGIMGVGGYLILGPLLRDYDNKLQFRAVTSCFSTA